MPVAWFVIFTSAPATVAPLASVIVPTKLPSVAWPNSQAAKLHAINTADAARPSRSFINSPQSILLDHSLGGSDTRMRVSPPVERGLCYVSRLSCLCMVIRKRGEESYKN